MAEQRSANAEMDGQLQKISCRISGTSEVIWKYPRIMIGDVSTVKERYQIVFPTNHSTA